MDKKLTGLAQTLDTYTIAVENKHRDYLIEHIDSQKQWTEGKVRDLKIALEQTLHTASLQQESKNQQLKSLQEQAT